MPYCFISYSDQDEPIAEFIYNEICRLNFTAYKAKVSLEPGEKWSHRTLNKLKNSEWVIFLASRKACSSTVKNPEVGDALLASKNLVPIVWASRRLSGFCMATANMRWEWSASASICR